jgi:hypothetical protein
MGKYDQLFRYLQRSQNQQVTLTYSEIEKILGVSLPASSHKDPRWWLNHDKTHVQSSAWCDAKFVVKKVVLGEYVIFSRE